jgi:hypothetical protein
MKPPGASPVTGGCGASDRHGQANGDIKQHGARIKGVVER